MVRQGFLLAHPPFRRYWISHLLATTGTWFWRTIAPIILFKNTNDPVWLGLFSLMAYGPVILVSFLGGILADRFDKRNVAALFQLLIVLVFLLLAVASRIQSATNGLLLAAALLESVFYALAKPSVQAVLYQVVAPEDLGRAVPLNTSQYSIAQIIGPVIAVAIVETVGVSVALLVAALLYLPVILVMKWFIPAFQELTSDKKASNNESEKPHNSKHGNLYTYLISVALGSVAVEGSVRVLAPLIARDISGDPDRAGLLISGHAVGGILGIAVVIFGQRVIAELRLYRLGFVGLCFSILAFSSVRSLELSVLCATLVGATNAVSFNIATTLIHRNSTNKNRGRSMSLHNIALLGTRPIAGLATGMLSASFGWSASVRLFAVVALVPLIADLARRNRWLSGVQ